MNETDLRRVGGLFISADAPRSEALRQMDQAGEKVLLVVDDDQRLLGITDLINHYIDAGIKVGVYPVSEKSWMDMGQFEELDSMRIRMGLE